ncbi:MAG: hypothetical protein JXQ87_15440 [Bacteroidia bacterium]
MASYAFLTSLFKTNAWGNSIKPIAEHWAIQLNEYCSDLRKESISQEEWQIQIQRLYSNLEVSEILKFIDFDNLTKGFEYPDLGVNTKMVKFPKLAGLPERTAFVKKIFGMKKDRSIIPHGHSNMASAHLILKGDMHLRHYDKLSQDGDYLIIKPTVDKVIGLGEHSTISDDKDNVHWFIANSETAFTFDVIMLDLKNKNYDIHNLDIYESVDLKNGNLRVPILDVETALKKYGKHHH